CLIYQSPGAVTSNSAIKKKLQKNRELNQVNQIRRMGQTVNLIQALTPNPKSQIPIPNSQPAMRFSLKSPEKCYFCRRKIFLL
ncbi:MAG: hypothetical protein IKQ75_10380, partial [Bacteroidales bacterium]|nr:hypothetical protein [Bacteroidales bacterium]